MSSLSVLSGYNSRFCEIFQCVGGVTGDGGEENRADGDGTVGRTNEGGDNEDEEIEMETPE